MNDQLLNISSSPHFRQKLTTGSVMTNVVIALMPATVFGIYRYRLHAFLIIACAILATTVSEFVFDFITKKPKMAAAEKNGEGPCFTEIRNSSKEQMNAPLPA